MPLAKTRFLLMSLQINSKKANAISNAAFVLVSIISFNNYPQFNQPYFTLAKPNTTTADGMQNNVNLDLTAP